MKTHKKNGLIRWSIRDAAREFELNRSTLGRKLRAEGIKAGKDGKFSTAQVVAALIGDKQHRAARLRSDRAHAKRDELEMEQVEREIAAERAQKEKEEMEHLEALERYMSSKLWGP